MGVLGALCELSNTRKYVYKPMFLSCLLFLGILYISFKVFVAYRMVKQQLYLTLNKKKTKWSTALIY